MEHLEEGDVSMLLAHLSTVARVLCIQLTAWDLLCADMCPGGVYWPCL